MIHSVTTFPTVDYATHPAYRIFPAAPTTFDAGIEEAIRSADVALEGIPGSSAFVPPDEIEGPYRTRVEPALDAIGRLAAEALPAQLLVTKAFQAALAETRSELLKEALFLNEKKRFEPPRGTSSAAERIASELAEDGLSLNRVPADKIAAMNAELGPYRQRLIEQSATNGGTNCSLALPHAGAYWTEVSDFLERSGILAGCARYRMEPLELSYCALVLSHDGEQWWKGCYADVGIPTTRSVYMHNDHDYDLMKALIYLDDVNEDRGPFCFVRGSHKWRRSRTQSHLFKTLDHALNNAIRPLETAANVYYRKAFCRPQYREQFMLLPRPLRGSSHFGDDVLDDSELSRWLLERETIVTSDVANCMAFIGADGIHRGGCVRQGKRWALQLGLRKVPPLSRRIERQAKAAYGFARSKLRGAVRRVIGDRNIQTVRSLAKRVKGGP